MFWTDWDEQDPRIERATMAGHERLVIHHVKTNGKEGGGWPNGLALDYLARRVYWIDAKSDSIHTVDYEGLTAPIAILRTHELLSHPFALTIDHSYVYWTDWRVKAIVRVGAPKGVWHSLCANKWFAR